MGVRALLQVLQCVQQLVPRRRTPALETCSVLGWQSCVGVHVSALSLYLLLAVMPGESRRTVSLLPGTCTRVPGHAQAGPSLHVSHKLVM